MRKTIYYLLIILLAVISRLIPHPPNFTPIAALALFSGSHFKNKFSFVIPLGAMIVSDVFLGFHSIMFFVYLSFFLIFLIGRLLKKPGFINLFSATIGSSILFFVLTNFGVWLVGGFYQKNLSGLINCYWMAVPFFRNTILGDLFYTFSFFYGFSFFERLSFKKATRFIFKS